MEQLTANVIYDYMMSQGDSEVHYYQVLREISDHSSDCIALKWRYGFIRSRGRNLHLNNKTSGWKLEVKRKDGSLSWIPFKDIKASNSIELSKTSFKWWVKDVLLKRYQIILNIKSKYCRTTQKFGIKVPKTVDEA